MEMTTLKRILSLAANVTRDFIIVTLDNKVFINVEQISVSATEAPEIIVDLSTAHLSRLLR